MAVDVRCDILVVHLEAAVRVLVVAARVSTFVAVDLRLDSLVMCLLATVGHPEPDAETSNCDSTDHTTNLICQYSEPTWRVQSTYHTTNDGTSAGRRRLDSGRRCVRAREDLVAECRGLAVPARSALLSSAGK